MNIYRLGVCLKCHGDLALDEGDWICLQCGVYYYTGLYSNSAAQPSGPGGDGGLLRIAGATLAADHSSRTAPSLAAD